MHAHALKKSTAVCAAFLSLGIVVWAAVVPGWVHQTTDFPNYYTAAVLTRQRMPLRLFYDWTWFQRQMNFAGVEGQLGGYIPQTPLTMIPLVPLSWMPQQIAKRWWLLLNLLFLALTIQVLSRITGFRVVTLWLLTFACYQSLRSNLVIGQYYLLVLLLLTLAAYCLLHLRERTGGALAGVVFGLKLYSAPFLLYFVAKRRWRAAGGMMLAVGVCLLLATAIFGWSDVAYFGAQVLPRSLEGETLNPFHPGNVAISTTLRRTLLAEPELNPHPLFAAPALFFFLQPLFMLAIPMIPIVSAASSPDRIEARELAWLVIALLLASPNIASYSYVLLILPVALRLKELPPGRRWLVLLPYFLIGFPWAFPRIWLLAWLFIESSWGRWKTIQPRVAIAAGVAVVLASAASAAVHLQSYRAEPGRTLALAVNEPGAIYSGSPVVSKAGIFYQAIVGERYQIRKSNDNRIETLTFAAEMFGPTAPDAGTPVYFEMVKAGTSRIAALDRPVPITVPEPREPAVSHDGRLIAVVSRGTLCLFDGSTTRKLLTPAAVKDPSFIPGDRGIVFAVDGRIYTIDLSEHEAMLLLSRRGLVARPSVSQDLQRVLFASSETGSWQVWMAEMRTGNATRLTGGRCNNWMPTWGLDPDEIVFSSDCGRGLGLPALYRMRLENVADVRPKHLDLEAALPFASGGRR
jgi:hypothetical protein